MMPTIQEMIIDLEMAGWIRTKDWTVWMSPNGALFRGPYGAWKVMRGLADKDSEYVKQEFAI